MLECDLNRINKLECSRNKSRIHMQNARDIIDPVFNKLHDELEVAYYHYWKKGLSKKFLTFDKEFSPSESKVKFDRLHSVLFQLHLLALHKTNQSQPENDVVPIEQYGYCYDDNGNITLDKLKAARDTCLANRDMVEKLIAALNFSAISTQDLE